MWFFLDETVIGCKCHWMKMSLDEKFIGWKCQNWMKVFWMKVSLDEIVFGWTCHWMKSCLDESVIGWNRFWMKVYFTVDDHGWKWRGRKRELSHVTCEHMCIYRRCAACSELRSVRVSVHCGVHVIGHSAQSCRCCAWRYTQCSVAFVYHKMFVNIRCRMYSIYTSESWSSLLGSKSGHFPKLHNSSTCFQSLSGKIAQ